MRQTVVLIPLVFTLILFSCSTPSDPPTGDPPHSVDTTSHDIDWEVIGFGTSPVASSVIFDLHIYSENDIWLVGEMEVDTTILTTPNRQPRELVNAVHFDGAAYTPYALEGIKAGGGMGLLFIESVTGRKESTYFMSILGCTQVHPDTIVYHDLLELWDLWEGQGKISIAPSGRIMLYGRKGFLAELRQDSDFSPIHIQQLQLPTDIPVVAYEEITPDNFYVGCATPRRDRHHFYHMINGELVEYIFPADSLYRKDICNALWSSSDRIFSAGTPYMFSESIQDTSDRMFFNMLDDISFETTVGYIKDMAGRANNDIFLVGDYGTILHFNGASFHLYEDIQSRMPAGIFYSVSVHNNKVYVVGGGRPNGEPRGVLLIGTINQ